MVQRSCCSVSVAGMTVPEHTVEAGSYMCGGASLQNLILDAGEQEFYTEFH
jgi:hypothetical protein